MNKAWVLASLLPRDPLEFYDRLTTQLDARFESLWIQPATYEPRGWSEVISGIEESLGTEVTGVLDESAYGEIARDVRRGIDEIRSQAPFPLAYNGDFVLASLCYAVCRALKPAIVLETGVAYGVTSAFILKALETNGFGRLHSVDLPPLERGAEHFVGVLVPEYLKSRWRFHRGSSKRILPILLERETPVDVFIHDSLHTYRNMGWEFRSVATNLAPRAIVIADDVEGNRAFLEWVKEVRPAFWATIEEKEKKNICGVVVFNGTSSKNGVP